MKPSTDSPFWYRHEPLQVQHAEGRLSGEQTGAHRLLAEAYFHDPGSLKDDQRTLARIAGVPLERWPDTWTAIEHLFRVKEGKEVVSRWGEHWRNEALRHQQKQRESGQRGGVRSAEVRRLKVAPNPDHAAGGEA